MCAKYILNKFAKHKFDGELCLKINWYMGFQVSKLCCATCKNTNTVFNMWMQTELYGLENFLKNNLKIILVLQKNFHET